MNHTMRKVVLITAGLVLMTAPVLAEDATYESVAAPAIHSGKDLCLLEKPSSCDRVWTITGKINRIENEINKGTSVYTKEELKILHKRLDDAHNDLIEDQKGGW